MFGQSALLHVDDRGLPTRVAGVPPDAYSDTGQRWGNPLFDWSAMAADGYQWWIERIRRSLDHCDAWSRSHRFCTILVS